MNTEEENVLQMIREERDLGVLYGHVDGLIDAAERLQNAAKECKDRASAQTLIKMSLELAHIAKIKAEELRSVTQLRSTCD